jgi:hypothetical protein
MGGMSMIEQDYVDFCNVAFAVEEQARTFLEGLSDEHIYQLCCLVRNEWNAASGNVSAEYAFMKTLLDAEADRRQSGAVGDAA